MYKLFRILLVVTFVFVAVLSFRSVNAHIHNNFGDIIVQTIPGQTVAEKLTSKTKSSWPWYLARGSGMAAAVFLIILLLSGIGLVTGYTFRFLEPLTAWASHRALGIAFSVSVLVHMFSLIFDKFVQFNLLQLFIPWLSTYKPVTILGYHLGSFYVAIGVIAFYLTIAIVLSSLFWVDKKPRTWKFTHILSYLVIVLVFVHALYLGTDLVQGILRKIWILSGVIILGAIIHRTWRAWTAL